MSFSNEYNENKRLFPKPVKPNSAPITSLVDKGASGGKGPGQDGWESLDGVVAGPVQATTTSESVLAAGTRVRNIVNRDLGRVDSFSNGYYKVRWDNGTFWAMKRKEIEVVPERLLSVDRGHGRAYTYCDTCSKHNMTAKCGCTCHNADTALAAAALAGALEAGGYGDMDNEGPVVATPKGLDEAALARASTIFQNRRTAREIAASEARRVPRRWPDNGVSIPTKITDPMISSNVIFPREREDGEPVVEKKIHQFGLNEDLEDDFNRTSIDTSGIPFGDDDQNDFGGLESMENVQEIVNALEQLGMNGEDDDTDNVNRDAIGTDAEDDKYRPHFPSEQDYRSEGFYENLFIAKDEQPFTWVFPNYLAGGAHPIFTSHLDDLAPLRKAGFKAIITLFDKKLDEKHTDGFEYLFVPTYEGFSTDLPKICKFIDTQISLERPVFIHSLQGKGRTATALAAYLVYKNYVSGPDEAIAYIRQNYQNDAIETTYQEDALMRFALDE